MKTMRSDGADTRHRLLEAAVALFAEQGFRNTRTADICRRAGANIAAVNYHFGGKEELYIAAWRHAFERSLQAYPADGGVPADAPAATRLRGHIEAAVRRFADPASRDLDIADREMADPTGLLAEVMHRGLDPLRRMHLAIVQELLGPDADPRQMQLCEMSVHAQCFMALMHERRQRRPPPPDGRRPAGPRLLKIDTETLVDHVTRFSLAGIREVRHAAPPRAGRRPLETAP
jgi:AcrR family transcriptional regulator